MTTREPETRPAARVALRGRTWSARVWQHGRRLRIALGRLPEVDQAEAIRRADDVGALLAARRLAAHPKPTTP